MQHKSSLGTGYFEKIYSEDPDPWQFETSDYERAKYDQTLAALPRRRFECALEIGCANGVLTERLASYCDRLIAVDIVDRALEKARQRCAGLSNVDIIKAAIPDERVESRFDLILLSEVAYYWDSADIGRAGEYFCDTLVPAGHLLLVHWTGETDYPKSADEAVAELRLATDGMFTETQAQRHKKYRLDVWQKQCG